MSKKKKDKFFKKPQTLIPSAMRSVADIRLADAKVLLGAGQKHRNGAVYMAGFAVEVLLKARLITKYGSIAKKRPHQLQGLSESEKEIWALIWRSHDLGAMLGYLKDVETALIARSQWEGKRDYWVDLKAICAEWTIQARYASRIISPADAKDFLGRVERVKELLK